jgi:hypothetical protein
VSRDQILTELFKSKFMNDLLSTITSNHPLKEELKSELFLILCEMREEKIVDAFSSNYLNYLCVSIVKNQYHSSTSSFHKVFRKWKGVEGFNLDNVDDIAEQSDWIEKESMLRLVEDIVESRLGLVDKELFKIYYKMGRYDKELGDLRDKDCKKATSSYRKIEKKLSLEAIPGQKKITIDHATIGLSIVKSLNKIRGIIYGVDRMD